MLLPLLKVIVTLLLLLASVSLGEVCQLLANPSGSIVFDEYKSSGIKCWTVRVPSNSFTTLEVERFHSDSYGCDYHHIEVKSSKRTSSRLDFPSQAKVTKYCPNVNAWNTFTAFDNFTIYLTGHRSNYETRIRLTLNYHSENIICARSDSFVCPGGFCVPGHKVCDGIKDCYDGSDEFGCLTGVFAAEGISSSRERSVEWMKNRWSLTSGWSEKTPRAIIALNLATEGNFTDTNTQKELVVKQLEVQLLSVLLRNATDEVSINQLSTFVNALLVTCQNPRNFHGFDLESLLEEHAQVSSLASVPFAYLALCNAKVTLPENATTILDSILTSDTNYPFILDIQAVSIMALSCIQNQHPSGYNSSKELANAVSKMKQLQRRDGSFGNIYTTAIITQALLSNGQEHSSDWSVKSAVTHMMEHLNSSEVDYQSTALILPILNGKSMADIQKTNCSGSIRNRSNDPASEIKDKLGPKMRVQYSLYIGDEKDIIHTISLRVPENVTAFDVMNLAADADAKYKFKWKEMKSSKYVYEIAGITNDFEDNQFWFLYLGKNEASIIHSTKSPDHSVLHNGDHMAMWYKKAEIAPGVVSNNEENLKIELVLDS